MDNNQNNGFAPQNQQYNQPQQPQYGQPQQPQYGQLQQPQYGQPQQPQYGQPQQPQYGQPQQPQYGQPQQPQYGQPQQPQYGQPQQPQYGQPQQPQYGQPQYGQPMPVQSNGAKGLGIASFVLGIVSLFICGLPCSIVGLILGSISLSKQKENNGLATVGMIICFIGLFLTIITISCVSSDYFDVLEMFDF